MDDFLHHLIVVAAFSTAALVVKLALAVLASFGLSDAGGLSGALQVSFGLAAAFAAHHRTRRGTGRLARS